MKAFNLMHRYFASQTTVDVKIHKVAKTKLQKTNYKTTISKN